MLHPRKAENGTIIEVTFFDALVHFLSIGWKVLFAICPPPQILGGWACFVIAIVFIGCVTYVVGETATLLGCVLGIKKATTAITFVAIGTSLPDSFVSKIAATKSNVADEAIGNITGSNCVNVFVGMGLPWVIASSYYYNKGDGSKYTVPAPGLKLSVIMYLACSGAGFLIFIFRRITVGGELGGSFAGRFISALFFFVLWLVYVIIAILGFNGTINMD